MLRYESVIHEFDPYFNYRSTIKLVSEGAYEFWNWFDAESWHPLGRVVGGTVYPGLMFTAAALYKVQHVGGRVGRQEERGAGSHSGHTCAHTSPRTGAGVLDSDRQAQGRVRLHGALLRGQHGARALTPDALSSRSPPSKQQSSTWSLLSVAPQAIVVYLFGTLIKDRGAGLLAAAFISIVPGARPPHHTACLPRAPRATHQREIPN